MWRAEEGSTGRLMQFCIAYFLFYIVTGVTLRYFQFVDSGPGLNGMEFVFYSTLGGSSIALSISLALRWYRFKSSYRATFMGRDVPREAFYIIPSGVLTAVIIATTTLMYSFEGLSIMVAMIIMRASVIITSRIVDGIQSMQGLLKRKVYWQENVGVVLAIVAASVPVFWPEIQRMYQSDTAGTVDMSAQFAFLHNTAALVTFGSYITVYAIRIYLMNYFRNTRPKGMPQDNKGFFALEQLSASGTLFLTTVIIMLASGLGWNPPQVQYFTGAVRDFFTAGQSTGMHASWVPYGATVAGMFFGGAAFFSVFLFLFKGRNATFSGLVNRLTSVVAGVAVTLFMWAAWGRRFPSHSEWVALALIIAAVVMLGQAEQRRRTELVRDGVLHGPEKA